jgi:hypothetical protein
LPPVQSQSTIRQPIGGGKQWTFEGLQAAPVGHVLFVHDRPSGLGSQTGASTQSQHTLSVPSGGVGCHVVCLQTLPGGHVLVHLNFVGVAMRIVPVVEPDMPESMPPGLPTKSIR